MVRILVATGRRRNLGFAIRRQKSNKKHRKMGMHGGKGGNKVKKLRERKHAVQRKGARNP